MPDRRERLIWLDLEMTGLDPEHDVILQAAAIVTEVDRYEELESLELPIWQPESQLERMTPFVRSMHENNGLLERVRKSRTSCMDAERKLLELVDRWCLPRQGVLAGNTIWQDRRFLAAYMPVFEGFLHFRQVDVTSWKILVRSWLGEKGEMKKEKAHTALEDARGSIAELEFYRRVLQVPPPR